MEDPPSPNVHAYLNGEMPPETVPVKLTVSGAVPVNGDAPAEAVSCAVGVLTLMVKESESWLLLLSVAVNVTVKLPGWV